MMPAECEHLHVGREFLQSFSWPFTFHQRNYERCYCQRCYPSTAPDTYAVAAYTYVIPRGWTRFAIRVDEAFANYHQVWNQWVNCYHGTTIENARSVIEHRTFLLPADVTLEGQQIKIREGHIPGQSYVFTTPSIAYAALDCYARTYQFWSPSNSRAYTIKVALQCKQKPDSIIVQPETVGARERHVRICPCIPNEELEWKTKQRSAVMIYGLLLQINPDGHEEFMDTDPYGLTPDIESTRNHVIYRDIHSLSP